MLYVDKDGLVIKPNGEAVGKLKFKIGSEEYACSMLHKFIGDKNPIINLVNHFIESSYYIHLEGVSRTEKNKGRDYQSSSYTVTAVSEYIPPLEREKDEIPSDLRFTWKEISSQALNYLSNINPNFFKGFIKITEEDINPYPEKDRALYQDLILQGVRYVVCFNPIRICGFRGDTFKLNPLDESIYLSHVTKFMEMMGNYCLPGELEIEIMNYELWLCEVFCRYLRYSVEELGE